ncbi:hypothetical protein [Bacteriovorax sp. Seq25_V]|uniref:hypothetical protein n=1 Tax=Bacteriovorax sp. Seq25_V TaxID=1201288 RepID=UPI00038A0485|nr:hypothetical protein [Bacteriovorax sp. Seq25_V]EQC45571.1 hypothetical protein M900_1975 [Bacteriovorax sp. Seq25_V]
MKNLFVALCLLTSISSFAADVTGEFTLKSGDSSCEHSVSLIEVEKGLRLVATSSVGSMFEDETAEDFLNINGEKFVKKSKSSSHGTKYVSEAESTFDGVFLVKNEVMKEYNFGIRTSKTTANVILEFHADGLEYSKALKGSNKWSRECSYSRN